MITIPPTQSTTGLVSATYMERTERIVERVVDMTREELVDFVFYQMNMLEKFQGVCEKMNQELESHLGYNEKFV